MMMMMIMIIIIIIIISSSSSSSSSTNDTTTRTVNRITALDSRVKGRCEYEFVWIVPPTCVSESRNRSVKQAQKWMCWKARTVRLLTERQMRVGFELCEHKPHWSTLRFMKSMRKQDGVTNELLLLLLKSALQPLWVLACSTIVEYSQQEGFYRVPLPAARQTPQPGGPVI